MPAAALLQAEIRPLSLHIIYTYPTGETWKRQFLGICNSHWLNILRQLYITNTFLHLYHLSIHFSLLTLKMEAVCSSEMSTFKHVTATEGKLTLEQP